MRTIVGEFGMWSIAPPLLVIIFAIKTKKPIESLLFGCVSAYAIIAFLTEQDFVEITVAAFFKTATDYDNVWLIFVCGLFGSLIALLNASKGTIAIARFIGSFCRSTKSVLMAAWGLGIAIFIDDYMNIMTIIACLKKLCDKKKIPRATLAYVINSTGAPTCVLVPFSTWAMFYASNFYEQESVRELGYNSAMSTYCHIIPYAFYAIIALLLVPLFIFGFLPVLRPLKKEYIRIEKDNLKISEGESVDNGGKIIDFIVPIGLMIFVTIVAEDMFLALIVAIFSCFLLYVPRKVISASEFCDLWVKGFSDLIPTLVVLLFAFFMKQACADIDLPRYVVTTCLPFVSGITFPVMAFVLVSILAFITGDSWGVPAICVPIIIPLGAACGANMLLTMAAVVSGGVFCSHACFYSDATVLTASCCDIDPMLHSKTQMPYAMIAFVLSAVLYAVFGFIM